MHELEKQITEARGNHNIGGTMKRYDIAMNTNLDGISDLQVYESSMGEWVKYVDVKEAVEAYSDWVLRGLWNKPAYLQPETKIPECNCYEHRKVGMGKSCLSISWVCPAHGYKERLNFNTKAKLL